VSAQCLWAYFFFDDFFDEEAFFDEADFFDEPLLFFDDEVFFEELDAFFDEDDDAFFAPPEDFFDDDDAPPAFFDDPDDDFFAGTLPPSRRASDRPMAMACLRLVTFLPEPLFSVPRLYLCISVSTLSDAFFPYLAAMQKTSCTKCCASSGPVR
jgi:hypothetical protein